MTHFLKPLLILYLFTFFPQGTEAQTWNAEIYSFNNTGSLEYGDNINTSINIRSLSTVIGSFVVKYEVYRKRALLSDVLVADGSGTVWDISPNSIKSFSFDWLPDLADKNYYVVAAVYNIAQDTEYDKESSDDIFIREKFEITSATLDVSANAVDSGESFTLTGAVNGTGQGTVSVSYQERRPGGNWSSIDSKQVSFSGSSTNIPSFTLSRGAGFPAGDYQYRLRVVSPNALNSAAQTVVLQADDGAPTVKIWKVWQEGNLRFNIIAEIKDENGVDEVRVFYKNVNNSDLLQGNSFMEPIDGYPNFYRIEVKPKLSFSSTFDEGDKILWQIRATDKQGNTFTYPKDLERNYHGHGDWAYPITIRNETTLKNSEIFTYKSNPVGAVSVHYKDEKLMFKNNSAIWYEVNFEQEIEVSRKDIFSRIVPPPKSGLIDLSFGDRSVEIINADNFENINFSIDRRTKYATARNIFDMVLTSIKPAFPYFSDKQWVEVIEGMVKVLEREEFFLALAEKDLIGATTELLDFLIYEGGSKALIEVLKNKTLETVPHVSQETALKGAKKSVNASLSVLSGLNNRAQFLIDVFRYPETEFIELIKINSFKANLGTIPGALDYGSTSRFYIDTEVENTIYFTLPPALEQAYFGVFVDATIYDSELNEVETTRISEFDIRPDGGLNLKPLSPTYELTQGTYVVPTYQSPDGKPSFPVKINQLFDQSTKGHSYMSTIHPYYIEFKLYHGGHPEVDKNGLLPINSELLLNTEKIPFHFFDNTNPNKPVIVKSTSNFDLTEIGFALDNTLDHDIDKYVIERKIENNSFQFLREVPNSGKERQIITDILDASYNNLSYRIKAIDISGNESVYSDSNIFTKSEQEKRITVLAPNNSNITIQSGNNIGIAWSVDGISGDVLIELINSGGAVLTIGEWPADEIVIDWIIPESIQPGSDYRIRVNSINEPAIFDVTENTFTIKERVTENLNYNGNISPVTLRNGDTRNQAAETYLYESVASLFSGGTGSVTYTASSSKPTLVEAGITEGNLSIEAVGAGIEEQVITVTLTGTDENGNTAVGTMEVTVQPAYGDLNADGRVNSFDATRILQYNVGSYSFNTTQQEIADIDQNGSILGSDANLILQYAVELIDQIPLNEPLASMASGVLGTSNSNSAPVSWGEIQQDGNTLLLPILLNTSGPVYSIDLSAEFDLNDGMANNISFPDLPEGWITAQRVDDQGEIHISMTGIEPFNGERIAVLRFTLNEFSQQIDVKGKGYLNNSSFKLNQYAVQEAIDQFTLENNFPNPFNPSTNLQYQLPAASDVKIEMYNVAGQRVMQLLDARQNPGSYTLNVDMTDFSSGVYFIRFVASSEEETFVRTSKMTLIK